MWKKKVEAGILLYALLMAAVFSLLLQFYLNRQVSSQRLQLFNRERTEAYAMAVLTTATARMIAVRWSLSRARLSIAGKGRNWKSAVRSAAVIPIPLLLPFLRRRKRKLRKTRNQLRKRRKRFRTKLGNRTNITVKSL